MLESTTYPGTTDELVCHPRGQIGPTTRYPRLTLDAQRLTCGRDFFLAFSPEREDPGNPDFGTTTTPKVVGRRRPGLRRARPGPVRPGIERTVRVPSARVAEATKLMENIFRAVNIALVNELKMVFDRMGIDVWEVLDAAETKPFGFMRFNPGPGLGGHCIPIDPFYLSWKAREYGVPTRFIELAGEINVPDAGVRAAKSCSCALNDRGKAVKGSKILVLGLAYKKDIDDPRESPAFEIIDRLLGLGADVSYHDPHIPVAPRMRSWPDLPPMASADLDNATLEAYDAVVIVTDHTAIDYDHLSRAQRSSSSTPAASTATRIPTSSKRKRFEFLVLSSEFLVSLTSATNHERCA